MWRIGRYLEMGIDNADLKIRREKQRKAGKTKQKLSVSQDTTRDKWESAVFCFLKFSARFFQPDFKMRKVSEKVFKMLDTGSES